PVLHYAFDACEEQERVHHCRQQSNDTNYFGVTGDCKRAVHRTKQQSARVSGKYLAGELVEFVKCHSPKQERKRGKEKFVAAKNRDACQEWDRRNYEKAARNAVEHIYRIYGVASDRDNDKYQWQVEKWYERSAKYQVEKI